MTLFQAARSVMSPYPIVEALLTLAAVAFGVWGCWVMHARLRNIGSFLLLLSLVVFVVYCVFLRLLSDPLLRIVESRAPSLVDNVAWGIDVLIPSLLCLCAAVAFLVAARSIRR
jgi:hypothetical protein